ncbi:MAG: short-chain dehydrogenase [Ignavibacteriaceae bacterium]|nr:short-chain dehydrogenase [Ignavibacteriaceae bacterium]
MDIKNKRVLVLGGWGLVGSAITRKVVNENPKQIILTSLKKQEAEEICAEFTKKFKTRKNFFVPWWGNIFVRYEYKDLSRDTCLNDDVMRFNLISDFVHDLDDKILKGSSIYQLFKKFKPDIVFDCINTATAIAYQNIYSSYNEVLSVSQSNERDFQKLRIASEKMISSSYIPQLIRHIQLLHNSMREFGTSFYLKVGTSGTGGMGLNVPYTHSEEKPSRVLLSKSSVAGAHSLLLFLMARTQGGPKVKELKPTASIAWKKIKYGTILNRGKVVPICSVNFDDTIELQGTFKRNDGRKYRKKGSFKTVYIDTGENGIFSRGEFETITTVGQMEFVTPEEIAENAIEEVKGGQTGHDIVSALDSAVMEPTYRAGFMQGEAVKKLDELERKYKTHSVAFEMLGPPRLSKLLYEAHLIRLIYKDFNSYISAAPDNIAKKMTEYLKKNHSLRNEILSNGIPILMPDGKRYLRGENVTIPSANEGNSISITKEKVEKWAADGWLDLRQQNWKRWKDRFVAIINQCENEDDYMNSSRVLFNSDYWDNFKSINIGRIVGWLFIHEENGLRIKS